MTTVNTNNTSSAPISVEQTPVPVESNQSSAPVALPQIAAPDAATGRQLALGLSTNGPTGFAILLMAELTDEQKQILDHLRSNSLLKRFVELMDLLGIQGRYLDHKFSLIPERKQLKQDRNDVQTTLDKKLSKIYEYEYAIAQWEAELAEIKDKNSFRAKTLRFSIKHNEGLIADRQAEIPPLRDSIADYTAKIEALDLEIGVAYEVSADVLIELVDEFLDLAAEFSQQSTEQAEEAEATILEFFRLYSEVQNNPEREELEFIEKLENAELASEDTEARRQQMNFIRALGFILLALSALLETEPLPTKSETRNYIT